MSDLVTQRAALLEHLQTGVTTVCRCWSIERHDGVVLGFTDHDRPLSFDGIDFNPQSGMEAAALMQTTGLSVDNTEGMGVLSDTAIREADIEAGRYDNATARSWLVNWKDPDERLLQFKGSIGEVRREQGAFHAELRGLTEDLNKPQGHVFQNACSAILGDERCKFDLDAPGYSVEVPVHAIEGSNRFLFDGLSGFDEGWFVRGLFRVQSGGSAGLNGHIKIDQTLDGLRSVELWQDWRSTIAVGDTVKLVVGCDQRASTCRDKFDNLLNFRGFPHIPGEDWLMSYPKSGGNNSGRSLFPQESQRFSPWESR